MIAHGLYQVLLDKWPPLSATFAVVCVGLSVLAILSRTIALSHVPLIGRQYGGYEKRRKSYQENAQRLYAEGYQKVRDKESTHSHRIKPNNIDTSSNRAYFSLRRNMVRHTILYFGNIC